MSKLRYLSIGLLLVGSFMAIFAALDGQFDIVLLAFFIPAAVAIGTYAIVSVVLLFFGFILTASSHFLTRYDYDEEEQEMEPPEDGPSIGREKKGSGFILIGPLPVIWGTSDRFGWLVMFMIGMMLVALVLAFLV